MQRDLPIEIRPVENGFIVVPASNSTPYVTLETGRVFQSLANLQDFLLDHFTFREPRTDMLVPDGTKAVANG